MLPLPYFFTTNQLTEMKSETEQKHCDMVAHLCKAGQDIADEQTAFKSRIWSASALICIYASNLLDTVKKVVAYNKPVNKEDVEAYLVELQDEIAGFPTERINDGEFDPLNHKEAHLLHMATGIAGESGEILDNIVQALASKKIDRENLVEELGDLEFYMEGIRSCIGIAREEVLEYNYHKLMKKRYPNGYSNEAALARADKEVS